MTPATTCENCGVELPLGAAERGVQICPKCFCDQRQVVPGPTGAAATHPASPVNDPYQRCTVFDEQTEGATPTKN